MADAVTTPDTRQRDMRILVLSAVAGIALGWWAATSPMSPVKPAPERPVLRFLARLAKGALWVAMFAEQPPAERHYVVHARVDADGHKVVNHGEGW